MEQEIYIKNKFDTVLSFETSFGSEQEMISEYELLANKSGYFNTTEINSLRERYQEKNDELARLLEECDRLMSHADYLDYTVAAGCGVLCGMLDSFFIGELDLAEAKNWGSDKINQFVRTTAHMVTKKDYTADQVGLKKAIADLEKRFPISSDLATSQFGGGRQHHLRDFSHHPNLLGLLFSLLTQFTGKVYGTDTAGNFLIVNVSSTELIGRSVPEKILLGVVYWFFHMVSDIAGSSSNAGAGTGLPGPILSLVKMASVLPIFKNKNGENELSVVVAKIFNGTLFMKRDANGKIIKESVIGIDFRTELGILRQQGGVVLLNEVMVRSFYFISRLIEELRSNSISGISDLKKIQWRKCIPVKNRTVVRMLSVSTTTFTVIDLSDAAIHAAYKSNGNTGAFIGQLLLRINFVGIGRTVIALGTDMFMELQKNKIEDQIEKVFVEELHSYNDVLGAERVHLEKIVCWDLSENLNQLQEIISAQNDENRLDRTTNKYLKEHGLDTQFDDFESFSDFMMNSEDDLII